MFRLIAKKKLTAFDILRYHVVQEFNKGVYDYIIATDESGARAEYDTEEEAEEEEEVVEECAFSFSTVY
jgi:hypothetical protein